MTKCVNIKIAEETMRGFCEHINKSITFCEIKYIKEFDTYEMHYSKKGSNKIQSSYVSKNMILNYKQSLEELEQYI